MVMVPVANQDSRFKAYDSRLPTISLGLGATVSILLDRKEDARLRGNASAQKRAGHIKRKEASAFLLSLQHLFVH
jgi:hypothetical protein